jgi:hypothetical protein
MASVEPISATMSVVSPEVAGRFVGQFLGYEDVDITEMRIRVCVFDASGSGVPGAWVGISAHDWTSEPKEVEADGCCEFAGLTEDLEFVVELAGLPCDPVQIETRWGKEAQVNFVER